MPASHSHFAKTLPLKAIFTQISEAKGLVFGLNFLVASLACLLHTYPVIVMRPKQVRTRTKPPPEEKSHA